MASPNNHVRSPQGKKIPPPVAPKPMKMTATRLMHKPVSVPPPPSSNDRTAEEDELDALTDLLVKNLEYSSDPDFFGKRESSLFPVDCSFAEFFSWSKTNLLV